jgi:hypothetical protein
MMPHCNKWGRVLGRGYSAGIALIGLALLCALFVVIPRPWAGDATGPEPLRASIGDLGREPQRYDKQMVIISGVVRSIEFQRGRRGSEYLLLTLEEIHAEPQPQRPTVRAVTHDLTRVKVGQQILVRGIYHITGNQGGRTYEGFIDVEEIKLESAI